MIAKPLSGWRDGVRYGGMGFPLAFVALPLYVMLPNHYARHFGVPLATLGLILLAARMFDAVIDPLLGRWSDRLFALSPHRVLRWAALACIALVGGFTLLFFPPALSPAGLVPWALVLLVVTYTAYSAISILHQSWGARLGGGDREQSRIVAWRESLGLLGIVIASISPVALGLPATAAIRMIDTSEQTGSLTKVANYNPSESSHETIRRPDHQYAAGFACRAPCQSATPLIHQPLRAGCRRPDGPIAAAAWILSTRLQRVLHRGPPQPAQRRQNASELQRGGLRQRPPRRLGD